jgi:hypothetical protein
MKSLFPLALFLFVWITATGQHAWEPPKPPECADRFKPNEGLQSVPLWNGFAEFPQAGIREIWRSDQKGMAHRLDSVVTFSFLQSCMPVISSKVLFQYDPQQLNTSSTGFSWDTLSGLWHPDGRWEFAYDQQNPNYPEYHKYFSWDDTNSQWQELFRYEYLYDHNGNLFTITYSHSLGSTGIMAADHKIEFMYAGTPPYLTERYLYAKNDSTLLWDLVGYTEIQYVGSTGLVSMEIHHYWSDSIAGWLTGARTEYIRYPDSSLHIMLYVVKDHPNGPFVTASSTEYFYTQGKQTKRISSRFDTSLQQLISADMVERTIGTDGLVTGELQSWFHPLQQQWNPISGTDFLRDSFAGGWELVLPHFYERDEDMRLNFFGAKRILKTEYLDYDPDTATPYSSGFSTYFYSGQLVGIDQPLINKINIYPNPASDRIYIEAHNCRGMITTSLFDLQGRRVHQEQFSQSGSLNVSLFARGIYLYTISGETGEVLQNGKIVVF